MTQATLSMHRSTMANMHIAHITQSAERRMQTQTARDQLRLALAEMRSERRAPALPSSGGQSTLELCKYLVGV